jgi:dTDP-4-amino-4,6-dideoxygalactose transaminase
MTGAVPIFVDCKPGEVNIDADKIENNLSLKTRAIMPVHAFGLPGDMDSILESARKWNLVVIEDAACALGSKYKDKYCGTFGDLAAFSFHPRKLLTTGEGGAIVCHDSLSAEKIRSLRNHGWDNGEYRYLGFNYRMTDFQAAIGIDQIEYYSRRLSKRRYLAQKYWEILNSLDWFRPIKPDPGVSWNVQTLLAVVDDRVSRDDLITYLRAQNIEATIGTYCVPLTTNYRLKYGYSAGEFPNAFDMYKRSVSLPLYNELTEKEIGKVCRALQSYEINVNQVAVAK